jgi:hypothetical protein
MMKQILLSAIALAAIGPTAHAEPDVEGRWAPIAPHANLGLELLGGSGAWSLSSRGHAGITAALGHGRVRPSIGAGATFAAGELDVADPRALSGSVSIGYYEAGPELRLGLRWVDGGLVDPQLFASFAYLRTDLDHRLMLDAVEGVGGKRGMRAALGVNWAQHMGQIAAASGKDKDSDLDWVVLILPDQAEVSWERSCGFDRVGLTLGWGI